MQVDEIKSLMKNGCERCASRVIVGIVNDFVSVITCTNKKCGHKIDLTGCSVIKTDLLNKPVVVEESLNVQTGN